MTNAELIYNLRYCFEKRKTVVGVPWYVWCDRAADAIQTLCDELATYHAKSVTDDKRIHVTDIEYLDGYFIFGMGTNSVVHFHVDECPGWKFGIWWNEPEKADEAEAFKCDVFAQYEETIDKFKPTRSEFCEVEHIYLDTEPNEFGCFATAEMIDYIRKEPYLAFCRDYCYWNYNREYHSREEAQATFEEYRRKKENKDKWTEILDKRVLDFARENFLPMFESAEIVDRGDCCSPRYEIVCDMNKNPGIFGEPGWYGFDQVDKELMQRWNELKNECNQIADAHDFCWFYPIDGNVLAIKKEAE